MKEKLLVLIGRIGKEARVGKIPAKVIIILYILNTRMHLLVTKG